VVGFVEWFNLKIFGKIRNKLKNGLKDLQAAPEKSRKQGFQKKATFTFYSLVLTEL
jgi:hypothetical protein